MLTNPVASQLEELIYTNLYTLMGTTSTGYGATLLSDIEPNGVLVRADQWDNIIKDLERCALHQTGTSTVAVNLVSPGTVMKNQTPGDIWAVLQNLLANAHHADPSQLSTGHFSTPYVIESGWQTHTSNQTSWTWLNTADILYFFNLGGKLIPTITASSSSYPEQLAWQSLINLPNAVSFDINAYRNALNSPGQILHLEYDASASSLPYTSLSVQIDYILTGTSITATTTYTVGPGTSVTATVTLSTDFQTVWANGAASGIAAPYPQIQQLTGNLTASAEIPQFSFGSGGQSDVKTVTLTNGTNGIIITNNINYTLSGYTQGTVTANQPVTGYLNTGDTMDLSIQYTGSVPGHYTGLIDIDAGQPYPLQLFTEINIGSTTPQSFTTTTNTLDSISQDFRVDHAGGYFKNFTVSIDRPDIFELIPLTSGTVDTFTIQFDPGSKANGQYSTVASVSVAPMDSSQAATVYSVPISVDLEVNTVHWGDWTGPRLGNQSLLGLSYDTLLGRTYLTVGISTATASISELRSYRETFPSWAEVYRIPIVNGQSTLLTKNYLVKSLPDFKFGDYFGVGAAAGSLLTVNCDQYNLEILMNTLLYAPDQYTQEIKDLSTAFRYYDRTRVYQLQFLPNSNNETPVFAGFEKNGAIVTVLVTSN